MDFGLDKKTEKKEEAMMDQDTGAESTDHQMNSFSDMNDADDTNDEQRYHMHFFMLICERTFFIIKIKWD